MANKQKTIYWIGWARIVGEREWRAVVYVYVDRPNAGWEWLLKNWSEDDFATHSLCVLRVGEMPYA